MIRDTGEGYHNRQQMIDELNSLGFELDKDFMIMDVPNITNITYGRDLGYVIEKETFDKQIEKISATEIRKNL
tara:strand:+ start:261 stop:479 length:219 start_codon:yes stop_codon:yes gene_type:complete